MLNFLGEIASSISKGIGLIIFLAVAGEKIFHSCILYVQAIFICYALDRLSSMSFAKNDLRITTIIVDVTIIIVTILSVYGTYLFFHGFRKLNNIFWLRYEKRVERLSHKITE